MVSESMRTNTVGLELLFCRHLVRLQKFVLLLVRSRFDVLPVLFLRLGSVLSPWLIFMTKMSHTSLFGRFQFFHADSHVVEHPNSVV